MVCHCLKKEPMKYKINLTIVEGSTFPNVNTAIEISAGGKTQKTSSKTKSSDPVWNEMFEFDIHSLEDTLVFQSRKNSTKNSL